MATLDCKLTIGTFESSHCVQLELLFHTFTVWQQNHKRIELQQRQHEDRPSQSYVRLHCSLFLSRFICTRTPMYTAWSLIQKTKGPRSDWYLDRFWMTVCVWFDAAFDADCNCISSAPIESICCKSMKEAWCYYFLRFNKKQLWKKSRISAQISVVIFCTFSVSHLTNHAFQ